MLGIVCQICNKREASTHLTELDPNDGQRRELHLCSTCIEQLNLKLQAGPPPIADILKKKKPSDSKASGSLEVSLTPQAGSGAKDKESASDVACANCGLTFAEFAVNNRFGCAQCYGDFGERIETMLARYHGSSVHLGRRPGARAPADDDRLARRARLDAELREAIAAEAYEKAARLRDEIRKLSDS
jgi:protein arginine kinase activator